MPYAVMNSTKPRPILKRASVSAPTAPPVAMPDGGYSRNGVRFPPHAISSTHLAYSADAYDRSPISVMPNECALPARGCPGRTYMAGENESAIMDEDEEEAYPDSTPGRAWTTKNEQAQPRVQVRGFEPSYRYNSNSPSSDSSRSDSPPRSSPSRAPSLVTDFSDGSEDSDQGAFAPFLNGTFASMPMSYHSTEPGSRKPLSPKSDPAQLAFLPHPHHAQHQHQHYPNAHAHSHAYSSPTPTYPSYAYSTSGVPHAQTAPRDPRAVQAMQTSVPPAPTRGKVRGSGVRPRRTHISANAQGFSDEGCLGGF